MGQGAIASPKPGDRLWSIEFEAALAREAAQAKVKSGAASSSAPASIPDSLNAPTPTPPRGGPQVFSSGEVVDDFLLPRGSIVNLPGDTEAQGSPRTEDRPAPQVPVSPPKPAPLTGLDAAVLQCQNCGFVGNGPQRRALHRCTGPWWGADCEQWKPPRP